MFDKDALRNQYPEYYPKGYFDYSIGDGWKPILEQFCKDAKQLGLEFKFAQVKEKFGGLRIYTDAVKTEFFDSLNALVDRAEKQAQVTCENCGAIPAEIRAGGWLKCLCEGCNKK